MCEIMNKVWKDHFTKGKFCGCSPTLCMTCGGLIHFTRMSAKPRSYHPVYYTLYKCDTCGKEYESERIET